MKISFIHPHKSITNLPKIDLPDLVILTGVNGAGKSHFLQALEIGAIAIENLPTSHDANVVRRYEAQNLIPNEAGIIQTSQLDQERFQIWIQLNPLLEQMQQALKNFACERLPSADTWSTQEILKARHQDLGHMDEQQASSIIDVIKSHAEALNASPTSQFTQQDPANRPRFLKLLLAKTSLKLIEFTQDDFNANYPLAAQRVNIFQQSFSRLFAEYQHQKVQNQFYAYLNTLGENHKTLSDDDFLNRYGPPPWDFVNSILESAKLNFKINSPSNNLQNRPYEAILTDQATGIQVKFNDLSSGERVLMSFALCLYYAKDPNQLVEYPKVLLFDEIDAPLHPSMTQSLLRTIQDVLIDQHKIKVIMTTHSPTTVALAPESALYAMHKTHGDRLTKVTKDSALSILMTGVPALSINYKNRRQVFVESPNDVECYEKIHEKLKQKLNPEISLSFISSGGSKEGGCDRVKKVVSELVEAGNKSIFGIIDWDAKNKRDNHLLVHGENERYTLENYIFDPLLVAALLFLDKAVTRPEIGLHEHDNHGSFQTMTNDRLQVIADKIIEIIKKAALSQLQKAGHEWEESAVAEATDENKHILRERKVLREAAKYVADEVGSPSPVSIRCTYTGNQEISIPKWYLHMNGHHIKPLLELAFPSLKRYQTEQKMKIDILRRVVDDIPSLIPSSFHKLFNSIQTISH